MPHERQAIINFGGILLNDNLCNVVGGEQFEDNLRVEHTLSIANTVHTSATVKAGRIFILQFDVYQSAVYGTPHKEQIVNVIKSSRLNGTAIAIVVDDYASFSCNAKVVEQDGKLYSIDSRSGGIIRRLSIVLREV